MAGSTFTAYIEKIMQTQLICMSKRYDDFSRDVDCRAEAKSYDARIKKFASATRNAAWAEEVLKFLQQPLSAGIAKYVTELETGKELKTAAQTVLSDKEKSDENERIRLAEKWDADIMLILSKSHTVDWCKSVESTYSAFCGLDKRIKILCRQSAAFEAIYKEIPFIRKAIEIDKKITEICGGKREGEDFWKNVDKVKKEYDGLESAARKHSKESTALSGAVALAEKQRKAIADELDREYQRVRALSRSMDSINKCRAFISQWEKGPLSAKKLCRCATALAVETLKDSCDAEVRKLNQEQADATAAEKWDKEIISVCGYTLTKGVNADRNNEEYRLKIDKLKADFDKAPAKIKALCKCAGELERAVNEAYSARKKLAASLDAEYKRVKASPSTRALVSDGRDFIIRWNTVPKTVKSYCLLVSDKEILNLTKFYTAEEKRLDEEDRIRARRLAEEKERERKRKEAEERERKKRELDNDINECYTNAKRGDANAMFKLAGYYFTGTGVTKSYSDAFEWYEKAAKKGHSGAMEKLGDCYYYGYGVEKSYSKAEKCYKKASKG